MHKDKLLKLADFLNNLPEDRFDISLWQSLNFDKDNCGTTACAFGWCPVLFPDDNKFEVKKYSDHSAGRDIYYDGLFGTQGAAKFFDITIEQSFHLFLGRYYTGKVGPREVAQRIRKTIC